MPEQAAAAIINEFLNRSFRVLAQILIVVAIPSPKVNNIILIIAVFILQPVIIVCIKRIQSNLVDRHCIIVYGAKAIVFHPCFQVIRTFDIRIYIKHFNALFQRNGLKFLMIRAFLPNHIAAERQTFPIQRHIIAAAAALLCRHARYRQLHFHRIFRFQCTIVHTIGKRIIFKGCAVVPVFVNTGGIFRQRTMLRPGSNFIGKSIAVFVTACSEQSDCRITALLYRVFQRNVRNGPADTA